MLLVRSEGSDYRPQSTARIFSILLLPPLLHAVRDWRNATLREHELDVAKLGIRSIPVMLFLYTALQMSLICPNVHFLRNATRSQEGVVQFICF